jgi:hypothetical protein
LCLIFITKNQRWVSGSLLHSVLVCFTFKGLLEKKRTENRNVHLEVLSVLNCGTCHSHSKNFATVTASICWEREREREREKLSYLPFVDPGLWVPRVTSRADRVYKSEIEEVDLCAWSIANRPSAVDIGANLIISKSWVLLSPMVAGRIQTSDIWWCS